MTNCNQCGEKPKKSCNAFPKAVVEINNPEKIVLFRKVVIPASMGGRDTLPPAIGKYHNVLLEYEADGSLFLYSSDGIPTQLSTDVTDLQRQLDALGIEIDDERVERVAADRELSNTIEEEVNNRQNADTALSNQITNLDDSLATVAKTGSYNDLSNKPTIGNATLTIKKNGSNVGTFTANATADKNIDISVPTKTSNLVNDGSDGSSQYVESDDLATVATSGSYNDLTNKPTIGNATLTIKRNNTNAGTFTANATTNKSINIAVPTKTSDLTNDGSDGTSTYVEADDLPTVDTTYNSSSNNAIANSTVTNSLDRNVMTNLAVDSTPSTTTVNLSNTKTNLAYPSSSTASSISLPVASSTQAGVMNSATFDAVTNNTNNINAILNGAVAISNLPASPTQAQLTTAWENETGLTSLINRASVYDVTNNKVWTYYTNDQTWHAASNTSQVTVNTFTNSSEGTIKGSTNDGQVFAESDGTGSVNGWDTLTGDVANNTSKLATIEQGAEVNVQANWTQTNTNADDYIKNKPANLVQDVNYVHTDNNFTTTLKNKLDGIESGAEVNVQADWTQNDTSADDYIKNKPTIPTVNNATLTIQKNGVNVQTFTANSSTNKTANITVPTAVSELTNDADYATNTALNTGLATKQNTLTAGDNITITGNTISATDTTYTAGNAISIENGAISADVYPADFFDAEEDVSDCGSTMNLSETVDSTIKSMELKGDTSQQTYSGYNLIDLVPMTNTQPTMDQQCAIETVMDATLGRNVLHITGTNNYPSISYQLPQRLKSGKYYVLKFTYRSTVSGSPQSETMWFAPNWLDTNYWDVLGSINNGRAKAGDGDTENSVGQSATWKTTSRRFYVVPSQHSSASSSYTHICFSLGYNANATKELWLADAEVYEITEDEWSADTYTSKDYEPYTGGPAPNPDYPQTVQTVTGEQTVVVTGKNLFNIQDATGTRGNNTVVASNQTIIVNSNTSGTETTFYLNDCSYISQYLPTSYANARDYNMTGMGGDYTLKVYYQNIPSGTGTLNTCIYTNKRTILKNRASIVNGTVEATISLDNDEYIKSVVLYTANTNVFNNFTIKAQLESNATATAYEPYQSQSYEINLGKNLLPITMSTQTLDGVSFTVNTDKSITMVGTATARTEPKIYQSGSGAPSIILKAGVTYHNSMQEILYFYSGAYRSIQPNGDYTPSADETISYAYIRVENGTTVDKTVYPMLEQGSTSTQYAPYFTPIKLCKIGDYQDYIYKSNDGWYLHKETARVDVSSLSGWFASGSYAYKTRNGMSDILPASSDSATAVGLCNAFSVSTTNLVYAGSVDYGFALPGAGGTGILIRNKNVASLADFTTYLSNNPVYGYFALATPTDTKITDATLVGQLNALSAMCSYNDQTNIIVAATGDNLPATLCVTTYRKSLDGVLDLINDTACTCKNRQGNLVIDLPNGMTTYTNNDAPLPLDEALEAFEQGRSIFFVDYNDAETGVYAVSAVNANDGIWTMKVERIGTNVSETAGYWVIETSNAAPAQWRRVDFYRYINKEPTRLNMIVDASTWNMTSATGTFMISSSLASQVSMSMTAEITVASTDVYFTDALSPATQITLASLWSRIANGEQFGISVPYGSISSRADISPILDNRGKYGMSICNYARLDNSEMSTYSYTDSSTDTQKTISSYNSNATVDVLPSAAYEHELMKMNAPFGISKISTDGSESDTYVFFTTIFGSGQASEDA